ncbi:MAG TPA: maleylacetoacetate isomerase [Gammaproteobacteria bacterium]
MKLYDHARSSAAFRVRIALNLKGCRYERVPVEFPDDPADPRVAAYRAVNAQGFVPALEHDGVLLTQSLAIIEYLDARFPEPRLVPAPPVERARVQAVAQIVACDIHPLNNLRVRRHLAAELGQDAAGVDRWCRLWIEEGFAAFEAAIASTTDGRHCFAGGVTLADVVLVPQVRNARLHGVDLARFPAIARVAAYLESLEPFARAA